MSIRRIKFLKRKKILQTHVQVAVEVNGPAKRFTAVVTLQEYGFPSDAQVWLEAKQLLETQRFSLGTIGAPKPPVPTDISRLKGERVSFNLLVVDPANARILGSAEAVRPRLQQEPTQESIPLLPVDASIGLGGLVWRLDYCESDQEGHTDAPVLMIDREIARGSASLFMQDPAVRALVLPSAMREVLTKVLLIDDCEYDPNSRSWRDSWIRFATRLAGEEPPSLSEPGAKADASEWIARATSKLARTAGLLGHYAAERTA